MDWDRAIERNREALRRILAALVAMAGLAGAATFTSPLWASRPVCAAAQSCRAGGTTTGGEGRDAAGGSGDPAEGFTKAALTLPRHLHRAVLRLLRPAESAARRLIIVAARGLAVEWPKARQRKPEPDQKPAHALLRSLGIAVVLSSAEIARAAAGRRAAAKRAATCIRRPLLLPLLDPLPRLPSLSKGRRRTIPRHAAPRILSFDGTPPHRLPPPPSPDDPIDAGRLALRLAALSSALDDLPAQARRFARWKARRDRGRETGRFRRLSPLRPGRPPGQRSANSRRPFHEIHDVLGDLQWFAFKALERPDTS